MQGKVAVRSELVDLLTRDLVGPQTEDEVLRDAPFSTYVSGVLYPATAGRLDPENEVDAEDDAGEATFPDPPVSLANARYPSSMGITFAVDTGAASAITVHTRTARYLPEETDDRQLWKRSSLSFVNELPVGAFDNGREIELEPGLGLYYRVRAADTEGASAVTLVLINRREAPRFEKDAYSYYQAGLRVTSDAGDCFVERHGDLVPIDDVDLASYRLLYRDVRSFAVGHGTSATWKALEEGGARAVEISTATIPSYELRLADSNPDIPTDQLTMVGMAYGARDRVTRALSDVAARYQGWISERDDEAAGLAPELREIAESHIGDCRIALGRMRSGIERLETDPELWRAFQLANVAMLRQRSRSVWIAEDRPEGGPREDESHRWRPFQIAFVLLNLDGLADPKHADRSLLDLLWFPTGGGKTEAYLGLIAVAVLLRRIRQKDRGGGVTVIMRYTLRLLTIQQFERAAALICALESIRLESDDLGTTAISIGLWVGRDGTPATVDDARAVLDRVRANAVVEKGNPMQVRVCPWCGQRLDHRAYWTTNTVPHRLVISCRNKECLFHKALPIHVVDEDLYREQPTLVIATADKFATLPWVQGAHSLFGIDEPTPPPELIVQDELHLISGPLGTLAGLYEAAIDLLCTSDGVRPKVIASTATIRRAGEQTRALFDRDMKQFPPPGIDAGDSFFAVTASPEQKPTRLYVGAMAPGTSQSTLMIRAYAALFQGIRDIDVGDEKADRDPYWTVVGYFNSLRVLGGARIQILDDVRDRVGQIAGDRAVREIDRQIELTSREPSSDIPGHLAALEVEYPDEEALDYVLATNMISVGVDIDRLGLMVVMGQPQATAEYIQATSRVGRQHPGLVLTLYNAGRSRDRSHYESFSTYHSALYRQVESTSVTPFSPRARDRALHAVLLSFARMAVPELRANKAARDVEKHVDALRGFAAHIADRADRISPGSRGVVLEEFEDVLRSWIARSKEAPKLVYANPRDEVNSLLSSADRAEGEGMPTPSSLRDVDSESNLYVVRI